MKKQINPTRIGVFVVGAIALAVAAVIVFGSGRFFTEKETYISFFEGSVFGLNQGASVVCRGVKIGSVTDIKLLSEPEGMKIYIAVLYEIEPNKFHRRGPKPAFDLPVDRIDQLIEYGLRVNLKGPEEGPRRLVGGRDRKSKQAPMSAACVRRSSFYRARASRGNLG